MTQQMNEWRKEYKNQRQAGRYLWVSGMFEKQGKLKGRLLCLPSLSVSRKTGRSTGRDREALGGTGVHPSGSNSSSHT